LSGGDRREAGGNCRGVGGDCREGGGDRREVGGNCREGGGDRREVGGNRRGVGGDRREGCGGWLAPAYADEAGAGIGIRGGAVCHMSSTSAAVRP
jgi:hypothetical protein